MRSVQTLTPDSYDFWDRFVEKSPQGSVFQSSAWITVIAEQFGLKPEILVVVDGDAIAGGIVLYRKSRLGIEIAAQPPATPYNGILHAAAPDRKNQKQQAEEAEVTQLLLQRIGQEVRYAHFTLPPSIGDVRPYQWCGWNAGVQFTYINSLEDCAAVWENLSPSLRRKITHAREGNFTISEDGDVESLVTLQELSYARSSLRPVLDTARYRQLCGTLRSKGIVRIYSIADSEGSIRSARAIVLSGRSAYYWLSGSYPVSGDDSASHLLLWEIFERLSKSGFSHFDFMGANTPRIVEFKRSFGGILTSYYDVSWCRPAALRLLIGANNLVQKARRRL